VDLAVKLYNQIHQVIQTRQPLKDETPYTSAFGTRAYEYIWVPVFDAEGAVEMVAGLTRDITDRKQAEAEREKLLQQSKRHEKPPKPPTASKMSFWRCCLTSCDRH
jgi:PAS fold.